MDVDLLRPGTVPISPDTFLGFEFLLDKDLLLKHLEKNNPDPSPTDLITKFYDAIVTTLRNKPESENVETISVEGNNEVKHPIKNIAMKILSLKVAAFLNWNLAQIRSLPFKTQISLLQDLMYFTSEEKTIMEIPNIEQADTKTASPQFLFALLLFHRWLLNTSMHRVTSSWHQRYGIAEMSPADENIICCPDNIQKTVTFLTDALQWEEIPLMLTYNCFNMPTETCDSLEFEWTKGKGVAKEEFCAQICFDLGTFFFFREDYELAKQHFTKCLHFYNSIIESNGFSTIEKSNLDMYVRACDSDSVEQHKKTLSEQLNNSVVNQFVGLTGILQQDNVHKEIPLVHRLNLELDIQGALSSGAFTVARDLLYKVKALNHIRCVLDKKPLNEFALTNSKGLDNFLWALQLNWAMHNKEDTELLKAYLLKLIIKKEPFNLLEKIKASDVLSKIFTKAELQYVQRDEDRSFPESLFSSEARLACNKKRKPLTELRYFEKRLISTYDWREIKELLPKIAKTNLRTTVWDINPQWELPIPLQSVIKSLPRGTLQDYAYVLLAKSREQLLNKNWNFALELLIVLEKELQAVPTNVNKLFKMVNWEILLIKITQLIEEWPKSSVDKTALANACEVCFQTNDSVLPRTEIIESCAMCLLNLGRWEFLSGCEKKWAWFEITSSIALACHEIKKGSKKFSRNLWDLVLPVFAPNPSQSKRSNSGYSDNTSSLKNNLVSIFLRLKDFWCLTVVISLLTKLYNIFKDETNLELQFEYMNWWPSTISNASSYNVSAASEMLSEILTHALKEHPTDMSWLRLMGDLNYANGNNKISLSYYLKSLIIFNDYFNIPIRYDDHVTRRMIKCCQALGSNTQAAVLCQFLEEPDYALAFRILGEQRTCNDAVDAYYHCFWDTNILEFLIHIHNRRGEFQRRKNAIQVMGMLELNSNNNEEIQREASNLRKSVFLRALCKQYVF